MDGTNDCNCLNCQLKARWREYYALSEQVIREHIDTYRQILSTLDDICENVLDIEAYFDTASRMSELLKTMGPGTVFYNYFYEHIDPKQSGDVRYFRMLCRDMREQIQAFNCWRKDRRRMRLVKSSPPPRQAEMVSMENV